MGAFVPGVIHDNEVDSLYDNINDFSLNVGYGTSEQAAILGFKYHGTMFFTANLPENRSLLNCVGFIEDRDIALPFKSFGDRSTTIHIGDKVIESDVGFRMGLRAITMECICANSSNYADIQALGADLLCRKENLGLAITRQILYDNDARIEYVKGRSR